MSMKRKLSTNPDEVQKELTQNHPKALNDIVYITPSKIKEPKVLRKVFCQNECKYLFCNQFDRSNDLVQIHK